eukprot:SAG22_NODE_1005_length_6077_cov_3.132653_4_plen_80_part_00
MLGSGKASRAESNSLILLYPMASVYGAWGADCWDWAGDATGTASFDTKKGVQLSAVIAMLNGLEDILKSGAPMPRKWPP